MKDQGNTYQDFLVLWTDHQIDTFYLQIQLRYAYKLAWAYKYLYIRSFSIWGLSNTHSLLEWIHSIILSPTTTMNLLFLLKYRFRQKYIIFNSKLINYINYILLSVKELWMISSSFGQRQNIYLRFILLIKFWRDWWFN